MNNIFKARGLAVGVAVATAMVAQPALARPGEGAVALIESPLLSPGAQALPRLAGDSPAIQTLNANLATLDARDAAVLENCPDLSRNVSLPMSGPNYVSFEMDQDKSCGGEFEGVELFGLSFDLSTGRQLDWAAAVPGWNLRALGGADYGLWASATLADWYVRRLESQDLDPEFMATCDQFTPAARADLKFKIWLSAEDNALVVMAAQPAQSFDCFTYVYLRDDLGEDDFAAVGLSPRIAAALHAAYAAENWDISLSRPGGARPWTED